ncbi:MAG: hypothetical protein F4153_00570 [Acidimicrobiia bacterium]|nr:hypothetical protein [Acidimicrobiia bacterium]
MKAPEKSRDPIGQIVNGPLLEAQIAVEAICVLVGHARSKLSGELNKADLDARDALNQAFQALADYSQSKLSETDDQLTQLWAKLRGDDQS